SDVPTMAAAAKAIRYGRPMLPVGSAATVPTAAASTNSNGGAHMGSRRGPERREAFGWAEAAESDTFPDLTAWRRRGAECAAPNRGVSRRSALAEAARHRAGDPAERGRGHARIVGARQRV